MTAYNKIKLGVNIDHVATLRETRGTTYPSPLDAAIICKQAKAYSITVHLREDRRHIQDSDVYALKNWHKLPINLEMSIAADIVKLALEIRPDEVCLVPERRRELTTEGGLDILKQKKKVAVIVEKLRAKGVKVSLFIAPSIEQIEAAHEIKAPCIELHTGCFCNATSAREKQAELKKLVKAAQTANSLGLQVNAGHGINLDNIASILTIPHLEVLNVGHSIIARAVLVGLKNAVREMLKAINK